MAAGQRRRAIGRTSVTTRTSDGLVPGRLAGDAAPDVEPRRALRPRFQPLRPAELRATTRRGWCSRRSAIRTAGCRRHRRRTSPRASALPTTCPATAGACCAVATASTSISSTPAERGDATAQNKRPLNALATLTNTAIGVGQLATTASGSIRCRRAHRGQYVATRLRRRVDGAEPHRSAVAPDARRLRPRAGGEYQWCRSTTRTSKGGTDIRSLNINPLVNGAARPGAGLPPASSGSPTSSTRSTSVVDQQVPL